MRQRFILAAPLILLFCGPALAGDGPGGCALMGPVENPTAECKAMRTSWQDALQTCLQSLRVRAEVEDRGTKGHPISAPAARAQMLTCQKQASMGIGFVR